MTNKITHVRDIVMLILCVARITAVIIHMIIQKPD